MPLSDTQIQELALSTQFIHPFYPGNLNPCGYDLTLNHKFKLPIHKYSVPVDPFDPPPFVDVTFAEFVVIQPHSFVLGVSEEYLIVPPDIVGICLGRSTYARSGIISHVTPLEPGWRGQVTIEISNTNQLPVKVWVGKGITQVVFFRAETVPKKGYGAKGGRYQNQAGVTQGRPE